MRVLYPGYDHVGLRTPGKEPSPERAGYPVGNFRQHVPVHWVPEYSQGGTVRGEQDGVIGE